ncbi:Mediator of RNA polymerase II transcription subunit 12-like protein [Varicellaria rhodocarpa]|nr:Mediator of RNA polymerase II transcription subunit 12-like protein [Varicellaria rhodocarpa]
MLLTLKAQNGYPNSPHAFSPPPLPPSSKTFSPTVSGNSLPPLVESASRTMSTPHRGLPLPLAMTLQNSDRGPPSISQPLGQLPAPPGQWQGADESMRNWLQAKAEEDRRKQEEERTRQEGLRLEQRKIEQTMLRESLQGGVPPYMVPMVFAGMGGANLANASLEWAQHYMAQMNLQAQLQQQQQQQHHHQQQQQQQQHQQQQQLAVAPSQSSPESRRDTRMITGPQPNPYAGQQPPLPQVTSVQPGQQVPPQTPLAPSFGQNFQVPSLSNDRSRTIQQPLQAQPTSVPRPPVSSTLPRLNTGEMQIQAPPQAGLQLPGQHPLQHTQSAQQQEQQSSSPSIYFHHWVPPTSQAGSKDPQTPSGKSQHESPHSQNAVSHLRSEYTNSPKKRKATGAHQPAPTPSSNPSETSPSFAPNASSGRRRAHSGQRSDGSSRATHETLGPPGSRPVSRHRQHSMSEAENGSQRQASIQSETHQPRYSAGSEKRRTGSGTPKREPDGPT